MNKLVFLFFILIFPSYVFCAYDTVVLGDMPAEFEAYAEAEKVKGAKKKTAVLESYAQQFVAQANYLPAENIYNFLISQNPSKKKTFFYNMKLGYICELQSSYAMSLDYYRKAEALYKKNIEVKFKIGDILLKSNLYNLAERTFLDALALDKSSNYARKRLGDIYFVQHLYSKALVYYDKISSYYYTSEIVLNMSECYREVNKTDKAIQIAEDFLISNESPEVFFMSAVLYADKKMYSEARERLLQSLKLDPSNFYAYLYLAKVCLALGNLDEADINLEKAYKINSSYSAVDLMRSHISYKRGRIYEARRHAHNALMKSKSAFTKIQSQKTLNFLNEKKK